MQNCFRICSNEKKHNIEVCLIAIHGLGMLGIVYMLAGFCDTPVWPAMLGCALITVLAPVVNNRSWKTVIYAVLLIATVLYLTIMRQLFLDGIYQLANNCIALINYNYGKELFYYTVQNDVPGIISFNILICYLIVLPGMILRYVLEERHIAIFTICNIGVVLMVLLFKGASGLACIFAAMSVVGAVMWKSSGVGGGRRLALYMYICLIVGLVVSGIYYSTGSYRSNLTVAKMRRQAVEGTQNMLYGDWDSPQGDLSKAAVFVGSDDTKLVVSVTNPGVYYLKGYVGGIYNDSVWNEINPSAYSDSYEGLFYWMDTKKFHPLSQNSEYITIAKDKDGFDSERVSMTIDNIAANTRYLYIPYGLTADSLEDFPNTNRDMNVYGTNRNRTEYSAAFDDYNIAEAFAYENPQWMNMASSDEKLNEFREAQVEYRTFVYDNYLELDKEWRQYFDRALDKSKVNGYVTVVNSIREWLEDKTVISEGGRTKDYLMYFLTKAREGNSAFYASAGTLMFRYYGIPARYVEGYLADISDASGESFDDGNIYYNKELTGANVHAWVEIYRDGIGWIPVDVTPGFYTELEVSKQMQMKQQQLDEEQENIKNEAEREQKNHKVRIIRLLEIMCEIIILMCVSIMVIMIGRSRIICMRRSTILRSGDIDRAIPLWIRFVRQLLRFDRKSEQDMSGDIIEILRRYRFRDGRISEADYKMMLDYAFEMQQAIYEKEGRRKRFRMKFVQGLI